MVFVLTQIVILLIVIALLYLLTWFWPPDSPWAPWWKTSGKLAPTIKRLTNLKKSDVVYELGSGDAEAMITVAKKYGNTYVGVEVDPWRVFTARIRAKRAGVTDKVSFIKKNFFDVSLTQATIVYVYLIPKTLLKLKKKFLKELKPGTKVMSYRYPIPYLPQIAEDKKAGLYVYEIPAVKKVSTKKTTSDNK
jgi:hypothetical protein